MSTAPVLDDPEVLLTEVRRTGFVTVPLLAPDEVAELVDSYHRLTDEQGFGCRPSIVSPDAAYRHEAMNVVQAALEPAMRSVLPDYGCVLAAFVPKEPGLDSQMDLHQDWSTCDERRWTPVDVWVALTETTGDDGALVVIPGSHHEAPVRGSGMPMVVGSSARWMSTPPVEIPAPIGTAVIFHPGIIHGSGPNHGTRLRLSAISRFQPRASPTLHYSLVDERIVTYEVDPYFYASNYRIGDPLPGRVVATSPR